MKKLKYKIRGLDCANEVSALRKTVGVLPGVKELDFDILNAKMLVTLDISLTKEKDIFKAVKKAGLEAALWVDSCSCSSCASGDKPWTREGVLISCILGGLFLLAGFIAHGIIHKSFIHALVAGEGELNHRFPLATIILYTASMVSSFWFIAPKAFNSLRNLRLDMNFLMVIAVVGAVLIGEWFEATVVIFLFAIAGFLEAWSVARARKAIGSLVGLTPQKARYICPHHGDIEEKPIEDVPVGVTVLVKPGEKIPLDGIITKGSTFINQAPITGESAPVSKKSGDEVYAGTINEDGAFEFKVTRTSENTTLARIIRMVEEGQARRAPTEKWIEKFARYYTPAVIFLAFVFFAILFFLGFSAADALYRSLVILVISCPCALVISTPVSIVAGITSAARNGVLVKGGVYLEFPASIRAVAMDKTGTLTYGRPSLRKIKAFEDCSERDILRRSASLEFHSEHPLAGAILLKAKEENIDFTPAESFSSIKGKGGEGIVDGKPLWIGSYRLAEEREAPVPHKVKLEVEKLQKEGHTIVLIGHDSRICGIIAISDGIKENALSAVEELKKCGVEKLFMLTGDNYGTAKAVASSTGIDDFKADLLPEDKVSFVKSLVSEFKHVAMVGDGVNDAPAMAAAGAGIAMGAMGTDAAIESSDIVLMSDDLLKLPWLVKHSKKTLDIIKQNIIFALGLKVIFMALALMGLATLWMAIAADMGASLLVIFNGLRLLRY